MSKVAVLLNLWYDTQTFHREFSTWDRSSDAHPGGFLWTNIDVEVDAFRFAAHSIQRTVEIWERVCEQNNVFRVVYIRDADSWMNDARAGADRTLYSESPWIGVECSVQRTIEYHDKQEWG